MQKKTFAEIVWTICVVAGSSDGVFRSSKIPHESDVFCECFQLVDSIDFFPIFFFFFVSTTIIVRCDAEMRFSLSFAEFYRKWFEYINFVFDRPTAAAKVQTPSRQCWKRLSIAWRPPSRLRQCNLCGGRMECLHDFVTSAPRSYLHKVNVNQHSARHSEAIASARTRALLLATCKYALVGSAADCTLTFSAVSPTFSAFNLYIHSIHSFMKRFEYVRIKASPVVASPSQQWSGWVSGILHFIKIELIMCSRQPKIPNWMGTRQKRVARPIVPATFCMNCMGFCKSRVSRIIVNTMRVLYWKLCMQKNLID